MPLHRANRSKVGMHTTEAPAAVFASVHVFLKLDLLREPLSVAARTARTLESSGVFSCSRAGPARGENEPYIGRGLSTPSNERQKKERRIKKIQTAPTRHAGPATIPSSLLQVGSRLRLGSPCVWDRDQITGETNCCIVQAVWRDILVRNARFLCEDGAS